MNVLLLNPPGKRLYLRDYFCSQYSKADYLPPPIDFLVLSGILKEGHNVEVFDSIVARRNSEETLDWITGRNFEAIIVLTSFITWAEDRKFFRKLKELLDIRLIGIGDILLFKGKEILKNNDFFDAGILDFTGNGILKYLDSERPKSMIVREEDSVETYAGESGQTVSYPLPDHELFSLRDYRWPFVKEYPFSSVLTAYGCPFRCTFCPYYCFDFKIRPPEDVIEEIKHLESKGIKEIYIKDLTFGADKKHSMEVCSSLIGNDIDVRWSCFSHAGVLDEEMIKTMKRGGCHTIMLGVESANDEMLERYGKGTTTREIREVFNLCHETGISTLGTFLIGLPGENERDIGKTVDFALELDCDYASFNVMEIPPETPLREEAEKKGWIPKGKEPGDEYYGIEIPESDGLTKKEKMDLARKAERRFYLRPDYLLKRLLSIKSFEELWNIVKQGFKLILRK